MRSVRWRKGRLPASKQRKHHTQSLGLLQLPGHCCLHQGVLCYRNRAATPPGSYRLICFLKHCWKARTYLDIDVRRAASSSLAFAILCLSLTIQVSSAHAQQIAEASPALAALPEAPQTHLSPSNSSSQAVTTGTIMGTITDQDGAAISNARIILTPQIDDPRTQSRSSTVRTTVADADGQFSFDSLPAGSFQISVSAPGFATEHINLQLHPGEAYDAPVIVLPAASTVEVQAISQHDMAELQIKDAEQQRVLGFIPNFYVTYEPNPIALSSGQKFELAWKTTVDPINFAITGAIAGIQQSLDDYNGFGQGASGYAKRYAASYGTFLIGTMLSNAVLPSLLKQDPRYFYKGTGTTRSRILYAIANSVICKGDNGRWQPNYSSIGGSLAAGAISNAYYPAADRQGAQLTFENAAFGIAGSAASNIFQEFVVRKLTPHSAKSKPINP